MTALLGEAPMRSVLLTLIVIAAAAASLPARDAAEDRRSARRTIDSDQRERFKQYLAAFRNLPADGQTRVRQLDKDLQDEDSVTRSRLIGVMERYAFWLSRLPQSDRDRIQAAAAGPERLHVVREVLEQQWLDSLPPPRKEMLKKATDAERMTWIEKWHKEERDRNQERVVTLRTTQERAILGKDERMKKFREDVTAFVKNDLEPKLTQKQRSRLQTIRDRAPNSFYPYYHQVLVFSEMHGLSPPGPPDIWDRFREPRRPQ
jgi:hypothetical protein